MSLTEFTIFFCFHSVWMILFFFCHVVVTLFTFCTCQCDFYAHDFHLHVFIIADSIGRLSFATVIFASIFGIKKRPTSMSLVKFSTISSQSQVILHFSINFIFIYTFFRFHWFCIVVFSLYKCYYKDNLTGKIKNKVIRRKLL